MHPIRSEGHGPLAECPRCELFVGLHEPVRARTHDDGPQTVEHLVHTGGIGSDGRVQADERFTQVRLYERLLRLARKARGVHEVPAEAGDGTFVPGVSGRDFRRAGCTCEMVTDEGFDGVGFVEVHSNPSIVVVSARL